MRVLNKLYSSLNRFMKRSPSASKQPEDLLPVASPVSRPNRLRVWLHVGYLVAGRAARRLSLVRDVSSSECGDEGAEGREMAAGAKISALRWKQLILLLTAKKNCIQSCRHPNPGARSCLFFFCVAATAILLRSY